jgi:electron transfer flavoprotein beta subunit
VLYTAAAKGADRLIKLTGNFEGGVNNHALGRALSENIRELNPDLILTGVQANNDLDGSLGPLLAESLGMSYVGYVSGITLEGDKARALKEYPGGLVAEVEIILPAVLGIQASEEPPRYVAVSKVRQAMGSAMIDEVDISSVDSSGGLSINKMFLTEASERAEMIEGDEEEIAAKLVEIFKEAGIL